MESFSYNIPNSSGDSLASLSIKERVKDLNTDLTTALFSSKSSQAQLLRQIDIRDLHPNELQEIDFDDPAFSLLSHHPDKVFITSSSLTPSPLPLNNESHSHFSINGSALPHYKHFNISFIIKLVAKAFNAFIQPLTNASKDSSLHEFILPFDTLHIPEYYAYQFGIPTGEVGYREKVARHFTSFDMQLSSKGQHQKELETVDRASAIAPLVSVFDSKAMPPPISIEDYLLRIQKYSSEDPSLFIMLLIFADRLMRITYGAFKLTLSTIHRFLIAATVVLAKLTSDSFYTNRHYAKVGGIPVEELNHLEFFLLGLMDWNLIVNENLLLQVFHHIFLINRIKP